MEEKSAAVRQHRLVLENRSAGTITGVSDVVSFDENSIVLDTNAGLLTIKGEGLHVTRLNLEKGEVDMEGSVDSLVYSSNESLHRSAESFFTRLFK